MMVFPGMVIDMYLTYNMSILPGTTRAVNYFLSRVLWSHLQNQVSSYFCMNQRQNGTQGKVLHTSEKQK